jgi:hypothetical protein
MEEEELTSKYYSTEEEACLPMTRHQRLRDIVGKYCLPDQADKVILKVLADMQGYDEADTHRNVNVTIKELAESNLGIV